MGRSSAEPDSAEGVDVMWELETGFSAEDSYVIMQRLVKVRRSGPECVAYYDQGGRIARRQKTLFRSFKEMEKAWFRSDGNSRRPLLQAETVRILSRSSL